MPHMWYCGAYCNTCYFKFRVDPQPQFDQRARRACSCRHELALYYIDPSEHPVFPVCLSCAPLGQEEALRGELLEWDKRRTQCKKCEKTLSTTGPRWWICGFCRHECKYEGHLSWV